MPVHDTHAETHAHLFHCRTSKQYDPDNDFSDFPSGWLSLIYEIDMVQRVPELERQLEINTQRLNPQVHAINGATQYIIIDRW